MNYRCFNGAIGIVLDLGKWNGERYDEVLHASPCTIVGTLNEKPVLRRDVTGIMADGRVLDISEIVPYNNFNDDNKKLEIEILNPEEEERKVLGFLELGPEVMVGSTQDQDGHEMIVPKKRVKGVHIYTHDGLYENNWSLELDSRKATDGRRTLIAENLIFETGRRRLDEMPYDCNGMHATGYEVCFGDADNVQNWWNEYYSPDDGHYEYCR